MDTELRRGFWLADRHVAPLHGEIAGQSGRQRVHPKAMEVLLCLARSPGKVVGRQRLIDAVWHGVPASHVALTHCISDLRHLLGDDPHRPTFIETVPKQGYRLLVPVTPTQEQRPIPETESLGSGNGFIAELRRRKVFRVAAAYAVLAWLIIQVAETTFDPLGIPLWGQTLVIVILLLGFPVAIALAWALELTNEGIALDTRSMARRHNVLMLAVIVIAFGIGAFYLIDAGDQPSAETDAEEETPMPASQPNSIAVIPFISIGTDMQNAAFADGLAEELLNLLSQLDELQVAARTSSFYFRNKDIELAELSARLGVNHILGGTVRRNGNEMRVRAELIDATTGFEIWSDTYDRQLDDIFSMQSEIARAVVDQLELALSTESEAELQRTPTSSVRAYDLYLQARGLRRQAIGQAGLNAALEMFNRALRIDPDFAEAHAGVCETYLDKYDDSHAIENFTAAEGACRRALTFETTAAAVYTALGELYLHSGQPIDAEREFRLAIERKLDDVDAHVGLAEALASRRQFEEAEAAFKRAIALEPGYWGGYAALGRFHASRGDFVEAAESYRRVTELMPDNAVAFSQLGGTLVQQGEFAAAARAFEQSLELAPGYSAYSNTGAMYYYLGEFDKSVKYLEQAVRLAPEVHWLSGNLAASYRFSPGDEAKAVTTYERAVELARRHLEVNPKDGDAWADLSLYLVNLGRLDEARATMDRALGLSPDGPRVHYYAALLHSTVGETEAAFAELERAVSLGYDPAFLAADPELSGLREDDRFDRLFRNSANESSVNRRSEPKEN